MNWNKTLTVLPFLAAAAAVLVSACGSGDSTGGAGGASGSTGSQASSGTTSASTSTSGTTSSSATTSTSSSASSSSSGGADGGAGACNNPDDMMKLMDQMTAKANAGACGQMCALNANPSQCAKDCMIMKMMISDACAQCWGDTIACAIQQCIQQCIVDPNSPMCMMCTSTKCEPAFHMCAGI